MEHIPFGFCHCGCGQKTKIANKTDRTSNRVKGQPMMYIKGHSRKGKPSPLKGKRRSQESIEKGRQSRKEFYQTEEGRKLIEKQIEAQRGLTLEQIDEAIQRYEAGESTNQIAESFGVCRPTVTKWIKNAGVEIRSLSEAQKIAAEAYGSYERTEEHKELMSQRLMGREVTERARELARQRMLKENNPMYVDGRHKDPYPAEFNERLKEKIRDRDNRVCQNCGITEEENGEKLSVHHIDHVRENCSELNLISLGSKCKCHGKEQANKKYWQGYLNGIIIQKYLGWC